MKQNERALLQERVRTLVLIHALEATLSRLMTLSGDGAGEELMQLEHRITAAGRMLGTMPGEMALTTMVAVEDAVGTIRGAFDRAHDRLEAAAASVAAVGPIAA
ncbi:hypothetical protein [Methylobacterium haplocladii]|uniref:Uncharacterized protein n=1 Tax=Methylobacterium haplocladii TaxID=1176176 RepID=A0A512IPW9_9HYPH|nr:hypothetical protein [Methylobacterium haplocladii]GEO99688.1 hypothetical protein MHA02_20760 [Methylobacterium haplocladii]GJD85080.1 hypothetical protein HPGCJGGD_2966 [Methylobacterium haplocladii]GLS61145.1 hypothetical protein GCM10007887_38410 [Methylobacterium haplocladii]